MHGLVYCLAQVIQSFGVRAYVCVWELACMGVRVCTSERMSESESERESKSVLCDEQLNEE